MWTFEPHVAESVYGRSAVAEEKVPVVRGERLDLKNGVKKDGSANRVDHDGERPDVRRADVHRCDVRRRPDGQGGVSYHVGREATAPTAKRSTACRRANATKHQFMQPVDPYVKPGDPASGLLPGFTPGAPGEEGEGDKRVQAYNFRMCMTDVPENRLPFPKPDGYDPLRYELLLRNFEAGECDVFRKQSVDAQSQDRHEQQRRVSRPTTSAMNYDYPEGDYAARERDLRGARYVSAGPDVDAGQRSARAGEGARASGAMGPGEGRVRRKRRLAASALRPRSAADDLRLRDDGAQLPRDGDRRRLRRPGRLQHGLAQRAALRRRTGTATTKATCRSAVAAPTRSRIARSFPRRASARTCWCRSACRRRTSPTARSAWSRCSWCWASRPRRRRARRSTQIPRCSASTMPSCESGCWRISRFWFGRSNSPRKVPAQSSPFDCFWQRHSFVFVSCSNCSLARLKPCRSSSKADSVPFLTSFQAAAVDFFKSSNRSAAASRWGLRLSHSC